MNSYIRGQSPSNSVRVSTSFFKFPRHYISNTLALLAIAFLLTSLFLVEITAPPSSVHNKKYDVFPSFKRDDVWHGFLSHLLKALFDQGIDALVDNEIDRAKDISESLLEKIEQSHIAIVIFSQNYSHSEWCLDELLKIAECRQMAGQVVIPVFYHVDPFHVQNLTGDYEMAQLRTLNESLAEKRGNTLKDTANLAGFVSSNFNTEAQLVVEIVKFVLKTLNGLCPRDSARDGGLFGIDSHVKKIMSLLRGPEDVSVVGIWGEPGIGKTTLAKATFDRISCQFDYACFFREIGEKFTAIETENEVHPQCFRISESRMSRKKLSRNNVILAFDDVSNWSQVESIMRFKDEMGSGSRIIVTSRDKRLLGKLDAKIYAVEKLHHREALQLFSWNAFNKTVPEEGYLELSERVVKCAQGLPLALKVLGLYLFQKSFEEWEDELKKFSNDGLSNLEKEKKQDIASCFRRRTDFYGSLVEKWRNALKGTSSTSVRSKKHDVFLSFRGADVRQGFASHLHKALLDEGIDVFVDMQLESGKEIPESLLEKVEQSHVAIVIFSQNYAHSEWCLEELLKIAECRQSNGQIVIPVFYGVDPSHVQNLTGNYEMARLRTMNESRAEQWGKALKDSASLSGFGSSSFRTESQLVEEIIAHTLMRLDAARHGGLVGIVSSLMRKVMSFLRGGSVRGLAGHFQIF